MIYSVIIGETRRGYQSDMVCKKSIVVLDNKEIVNIYITKALCNDENYDDTEEGVVYLFYTERCHKTIMNPNPYKAGELW